MKIMKVVDKKIGDKTYFKYRINLPIKDVLESGLENEEVKVKRQGKKIVIEKDLKE